MTGTFGSALERYIQSIPDKPEIPRFYVGTFDNPPPRLTYTDAGGRHEVPFGDVQCRDILNANIPKTWIAVVNGTVYALAPLLPVVG